MKILINYVILLLLPLDLQNYIKIIYFPILNLCNSLEKWCKDKCIIDIGSGINTLYKKSFVSKLSRKRIGIDVLGTDIKNIKKTPKNKQYARFVKGNAKTMKLKQLKLNYEM